MHMSAAAIALARVIARAFSLFLSLIFFERVSVVSSPEAAARAVMAHRRTVLSTYRKALRAIRTAFRNDVEAQSMARSQLRSGILAQRGAVDDSVPSLVLELEDGIDFLLENVVQAEYNPKTGNYTQRIRRDHVSEGPAPTGQSLKPKNTKS